MSRLDWTGIGESAVTGVIGGLTDAIFGGIRNRRAYKQAQKMQALNYQYGEMQADSADTRTRALYQDLYSPEAKVTQLEQAGLNPALMYSGAGAGGQQSTAGAQGGSVNVGAPNVEKLGVMEGALMASEIKLNQAKAKEAEASAGEKDSMVKVNEQLKNHYENSANKLNNESNLLMQQFETEKQRTEFEKAQAEIAKMQETLTSETYDSNRQAIINENQKRAQELRELTARATKEEHLRDMSKDQKEILNKTKDNLIQQQNLNTRLLLAQTINEEFKGKLNQAELNKLTKELEEITANINWKSDDIKVRREQLETSIKNAQTLKEGMLWQGGMNLAGKLADIAVGFIKPF